MSGFGTVTVRTVTRERRAYEITQADLRVLVALELLVKGDPECLRLDPNGDVLTIEAGNGMLKYAIVGWNSHARALVGDLIFSTVEGIVV